MEREKESHETKEMVMAPNEIEGTEKKKTDARLQRKEDEYIMDMLSFT